MSRQIQALVVDDSQAMRRSIVVALQRLGSVTCSEAGDGAEALRKFAQQGPYDLLVTDINMPLMDGLKLIAHVRQDPNHRQMPIVVITTESAEADRSRALRLGANAYLVKPVQAKAVIDTVKGLLGLE